MIVKNGTHKRITFFVIVLCMIGVLLLLRMVFVMGVSAFMNSEAKKDNGNSEVIATYYLAQAFTGDFMEPYVAFYNAGTSLAKANQPEMAERALEMSLAKVDYAYNECYVRNNLAKVQEQLGDYYMISDMASTAETYYAKAITTISESPPVCFPPPPPNGDGSGGEQQSEEEKNDQDGNPLTPQDDTPQDSQNGENMKETEERSKEKESKAKEAQGKSADGKEQVEKEMDQSKSEMDNQEDMSEQKNNKTQNQVDKPW